MGMMRTFERQLLAALALVFLCAPPMSAGAQNVSEARVFAAAKAEFEDGSYALSEKEMGEFVRKFPGSSLVPEAILYQARASLKQQKLKVAVDLLSTNATLAGPLADQYRYWLANAHLDSTNYPAAAEAFASLIRDFPTSPRLLAASYGEALVRFKLRDWPRVVELLQPPNGAFRKEALLRPADEFTMRGGLLLAEALLEQKDYRVAGETLARLKEADLLPDLKWHRQYLLCRVQMAEQRLPEALADTTNLLALATASGNPQLLAESVAMQGEILAQSGQLGAAVQAYEKNLGGDIPSERARQALLRISELTLTQGKVAEAAQKLENFLAKRPDDAASDMVLLTLGELHLKQHFAGLETNRTQAATNLIPTVTNHLQQALLDFERVLTNFPQSTLLGKAHFNKGWVLWADGRIPQSQPEFKLAADLLPHSEEQAVARFKLAEAQFFQKDYTNALPSFRSVLDDFGDVPRVKEALFDQALYQIVRASLELGDLAGANEAMEKILRWYPASFFSDRSMLLVGQYLSLEKRPADARRLFEDLLERFPGSPLAPEIELAVARTFVQENDWLGAIARYETWLGRFGPNELRPRAEYYRAWANSQAGRDTNALTLFTNFVARFPTNEFAPRAQSWVASYYYGQKDWVSAENHFQSKILLQNTNYSYQALMNAGRAAIARQSYGDAAGYFQNLIINNACPPDVKAEAYFALGDTFTLQASDPAKPMQKFEDAIVAFSKIPSLYAANRLVPHAWGRIGDCYFQMAAVDSKQYDNSTNAYQKVLSPPLAADAAARSQAEFKLATILEAMAKLKPPPENAALLDAAFAHFANLLYEKNLADGEIPDPFWLKEAGLAAGRMAEERKQWEMAINIYTRLQAKLPPLAELLQRRISKARDLWRLEKN